MTLKSISNLCVLCGKKWSRTAGGERRGSQKLIANSVNSWLGFRESYVAGFDPTDEGSIYRFRPFVKNRTTGRSVRSLLINAPLFAFKIDRLTAGNFLVYSDRTSRERGIEDIVREQGLAVQINVLTQSRPKVGKSLS